jgi:flagellar basal-body rod protein FlgG
VLSVIRSGLAAATQEIAVVSNNMANAGTTGFKRSTAMFQDVYSHGLSDASISGLGSGAQPLAARRSHAPGSIEISGMTLDMAVLGPGMFVLEPRAGDGETGYTRSGAGSLDAAGRIVNSEGRAFLDPSGNPITVPAAMSFEDGRRSLLTALNISGDGAVRATYGDSGEMLLGRLALARFRNETALRSRGEAIFAATDAAGAAQLAPAGTPGFGTIQSGALETSNTDLTSELVSLIRAQQTFSSNAKALQTAVDMDKRMVD